MPNASQVNLARVLAYIVEGRYSPLLYYCREKSTPMESLGSLLRLAGAGLCKERV